MMNKINFFATALYAVGFASAEQVLGETKMKAEPLSHSLKRTLEEVDEVEFHPFKLKLDNVWTIVYLYALENDGKIQVSDDRKSVTIKGNNKIYMAKEQSTSRSALFTPEMIGGFIGFTADLSQVGCGCVSSFYTVFGLLGWIKLKYNSNYDKLDIPSSQ